MERTTIIRYDSKPVLNSPVFVESLPGIGNVGKIAGDFIAKTFNAEKFASIYSENFPPQVIPDDDCVVKMACNELWYAKSPDGRDIVFLKGDYQGSTQEGQFMLARDIMEVLLSYGVSEIVTLGGFGTGTMVDEPHVYGAVSKKDLRGGLETLGVTFNPGEPQAGIIGAAGMFIGLGQLNDIDSFCLMGETSGFFADHKSAAAIVRVLLKFFGAKDADMSELDDEIKKIDELTEKINSAQPERPDDLSYIG